MNRDTQTSRRVGAAITIGLLLAVGMLVADRADARPPIRRNFFDAFPTAVGSRLDDLPTKPGHCGVCHYDFDGGGPLNPFGLAVAATPNRSIAEILALAGDDSDGDGFDNGIEITDLLNFTNTPTFLGLTPLNIGSVSNVNVAEIQDHLVPTAGPDLTPPDVTVISPNGGESLVANHLDRLGQRNEAGAGKGAKRRLRGVHQGERTTSFNAESY